MDSSLAPEGSKDLDSSDLGSKDLGSNAANSQARADSSAVAGVLSTESAQAEADSAAVPLQILKTPALDLPDRGREAGGLAPRVLEGLLAGLATELLVALLLWAAFSVGKQSFPALALLYFAGHGALFGVAIAITEQAGARRRLLGILVGLLGALVVFGGARFLQELIVVGSPLLAYGSLIQASGGFRWLDLSLYVAGAVACFGPILIARWRGAGWLVQAYAGLAGALAFGLGCLLSPLRFLAFGPAVYALPLLGRVVLFPLFSAGLSLGRRWRKARRERSARQEASGGTSPRARTSLDPRARHKARYLEGKAEQHLSGARYLEAGEAYAAAADLWPSAKRHLSAGVAFAQAEEPYRALAHLEQVLDDPGHDPAWLEAPELSYLKELEAWAPLGAKLSVGNSSALAKRPLRTEGVSLASRRVRAASGRSQPPALAEPGAEAGAPVQESPPFAEAPGTTQEAPAHQEPPAAEAPAHQEAPAAEAPAAAAGAAEAAAAEAPAAEAPAAEALPDAEPPTNPEQPGVEPLESVSAPRASADQTRSSGERRAPRRRNLARRRDAAPPDPGSEGQGTLLALVGVVLILGYAFSYAWTPDASADAVRDLWKGRLKREGGALYVLGRELDRGGFVPVAQLKAESGAMPGALLAFGFEPASGQCGITAEWAYQAAVGAGEGRAMLRMADILERASPPRPQAVSELLRGAAEAGEARAMWLYASRLRSGTGVERDPKAALDWIERGAETNHRDSQYLLASWLELGHEESVPRDLLRSLRWYQRAARNGHPQASSDAERLLRRYPELDSSSADEIR